MLAVLSLSSIYLFVMFRLSLLCLLLLPLFAVQVTAIPVRKLNVFRHRPRLLAEVVSASRSTGASADPTNSSTFSSLSGTPMTSRPALGGLRKPGKQFERDAQPIFSPKYVVAHHMIGNTYPYTFEDWSEDITLAHGSGIDGFALNMGRDQWQPDRVSDA